MVAKQPDTRSTERRTRDEQIAQAAQLPPLELAPDAVALPVEAHLQQYRKPIAIAGVVVNGVVKPLDPGVRLPEDARVIIVAAE